MDKEMEARLRECGVADDDINKLKAEMEVNATKVTDLEQKNGELNARNIELNKMNIELTQQVNTGKNDPEPDKTPEQLFDDAVNAVLKRGND